MTPTSPSWEDIRKCLAADGWQEPPSGARGGSQTDHIWFEKLLPDGRLLRAKISHAKHKRVSASRFRAILRHELEVSKDEFWASVQTGQPATRPTPQEQAPAVIHPGWVMAVLTGQLHMSSDDIANLSLAEAERLVNDFWTSRSS